MAAFRFALQVPKVESGPAGRNPARTTEDLGSSTLDAPTGLGPGAGDVRTDGQWAGTTVDALTAPLVAELAGT